MTQKHDSLKKYGIAGAAFGCILLMLSYMIINFRLFPLFCDSDMFVDLYPSKLMWEQKKLFPDGWVFGNQYFIIASPVWTAFFYGLTEKLCFSMALSVTFLTLLICGAWLWMLAPIRKEKGIGAVLLSLLLLLGGMIGYDIVHTQQGQIFFLCTAYYASYLLTLFVVYGCYTRDIRDIRYHSGMYFIALCLCFATGMQSLRQTAVMILPLGCVEAIRQFAALRKNKKLTKEEVVRGCKCLGYAAANGAGFLFIKLMVRPAHHNVYGNTSSRDAEAAMQGITTSLKSLLGTVGLDPAVIARYGIGAGILFLLALIVCVAVIAATIDVLHEKCKHPAATILLLFWIGILGVLLPGCLFNIVVRPIYYFTWYPLQALSMYYLWEKTGKKRNAVSAVFTVFLLGNYLFSYLPSVREALGRKETEEQQIVAYMEQNGYRYLYGDWSYVLGIAMTADGRITPGGWYFDTYQALGYVNPLGIYGEQENASALILLTPEDTDALQIAAERGVELQLVFSTAQYALYKADRQLMTE